MNFSEFIDSLPVSQERNTFLSNLLAEENISVQFIAGARTASFNTTTRVITLPLWKNVSKAVIDRLIVHEVGHARYTKNWKELVEANPKYKNFANIIEDRRVDLLMKKEFPGSAKDYFNAGKDIVNQDYFSINKPVNEFNFMDRANLLSKISYNKGIINFSSEEKQWLKKIEECGSTEEAFELAETIYKWMQEEKKKEENKDSKEENKEENKDSKEETEESQDDSEEEGENEAGENAVGENDSESESESDEEIEGESKEDENNDSSENAPGDSNDSSEQNEEEIETETDEMFEEMQENFDISDYKMNPVNNMPVKEWKTRVVPYSDIYKAYKSHPDDSVSWKITKMMKEIKVEANLLYKEFSVRREAKTENHFYSDRGSLDLNKVSDYKISDNLFINSVKRVNTADNHHFIVLVDFSGSMRGQNIKFAIRQVALLREFCKKAGIDLNVYAFSNNVGVDFSGQYYKTKAEYDFNKTGTRSVYFNTNVRLVEIVNNNTADKQFLSIAHNMSLNAHIGPWREPIATMGNTPLFDSCKICLEIIKETAAQDPDKKINFITLTDGGETNKVAGNVLIDSVNKKQYPIRKWSFLAMMQMIKPHVHKIIGFAIQDFYNEYIRMTIPPGTEEREWWIKFKETKKEMSKNKVVDLVLDPYDAFFYLHSSVVSEKEVDVIITGDETVTTLKNKFMKTNKNKMLKKIMAKKIAEIIA